MFLIPVNYWTNQHQTFNFYPSLHILIKAMEVGRVHTLIHHRSLAIKSVKGFISSHHHLSLLNIWWILSIIFSSFNTCCCLYLVIMIFFLPSAFKEKLLFLTFSLAQIIFFCPFFCNILKLKLKLILVVLIIYPLHS